MAEIELTAVGYELRLVSQAEQFAELQRIRDNARKELRELDDHERHDASRSGEGPWREQQLREFSALSDSELDQLRSELEIEQTPYAATSDGRRFFGERSSSTLGGFGVVQGNGPAKRADEPSMIESAVDALKQMYVAEGRQSLQDLEGEWRPLLRDLQSVSIDADVALRSAPFRIEASDDVRSALQSALG